MENHADHLGKDNTGKHGEEEEPDDVQLVNVGPDDGQLWYRPLFLRHLVVKRVGDPVFVVHREAFKDGPVDLQVSPKLEHDDQRDVEDVDEDEGEDEPVPVLRKLLLLFQLINKLGSKGLQILLDHVFPEGDFGCFEEIHFPIS